MTKETQHINISKHVFRFIHSVLLLSAAYLWLYTNHTNIVFSLLCAVAVVEQTKGLIVHVIEQLFFKENNVDPWG